MKRLATVFIIILSLSVLIFWYFPSIRRPFFRNYDRILLYNIDFEGIDVTDSINQNELIQLLTDLEFARDVSVSSKKGLVSSKTPGVFYGLGEVNPWNIDGFDEAHNNFHMSLGERNLIYRSASDFFLYRIKNPDELIAFLETQAILDLKEMTLDDVREMAIKGDSLVYEDFSLYYGDYTGGSIDTDNMAYIYRHKEYKIRGSDYKLLVQIDECNKLEKVELYNKLVGYGTSVDIRYNDIDQFIMELSKKYSLKTPNIQITD